MEEQVDPPRRMATHSPRDSLPDLEVVAYQRMVEQVEERDKIIEELREKLAVHEQNAKNAGAANTPCGLVFFLLMGLSF